MKRLKKLFRKVWHLLGIAGAVASLCATAHAESEAANTAPLKIAVNVPLTWEKLVDPQIGSAIAQEVRETLYRRGFDRPVEELRSLENSAKAANLLTLSLTDLRFNRWGDATCTFSAELRTAEGKRDLGLYTNTALRWQNGITVPANRVSLGDVSYGAIGTLVDAIARAKMLPGFPTKEASRAAMAGVPGQ